MIRRARARGERGAVIVEFALVIPILMLLLLALADFALAELSDAAGSNAAREGARVGILYFDGAAGTTGSTNANYVKISAAVAGRLADNVQGAPVVTVRCLNADGTARPSSGSCSTVGTDEIIVGQDLIEVSVRWERKGGFTGFIGDRVRTDKAVMRIVGTPPTGSGGPAPVCTITAATAAPSTVVRSGGSLPAITFSVTVSAAADCGSPLLTFPAEAAYGGAQTMALVSGDTFALTMPAGQGSWTSGVKTVTASANGGAATRDISFTVNDPVVCLITATSVTPSTVSQSGGTLSAPLVIGVTVSDVAACGTPTLTLPAEAGYGADQTMSSAGGNDFTFTLPVGQGSWPSATYTVVANADDGATGSAAFIVSAAPVCTLTNLEVSPSTATVRTTGNKDIRTTVTISVTRSSTTICAVPTVTVTPGASGPAGTSTDLTTPKSMSCSGQLCTYRIQRGTKSWYPAKGVRTVTVTASGSTVTATLTLI